LSKRFGISQTVLREALTRLCEQGLVVSNPKRGFTVAQLSVDDLVDLTNLRLRLEVMAFVDSIKNGDLVWETSVVAAHHTLERTPFITEAPLHAATWRQAHRAFHRALCAGSGSPRLEKVVAELRDSADLYRIWARTMGGEVGRDVAAEHRALVTAAVTRDAEMGERVLTEHLSRTTAGLLSVARQSDGLHD
jgi:DNA-binding GntR family transcriptional regulator